MKKPRSVQDSSAPAAAKQETSTQTQGLTDKTEDQQVSKLQFQLRISNQRLQEETRQRKVFQSQKEQADKAWRAELAKKEKDLTALRSKLAGMEAVVSGIRAKWALVSDK